VNVPIAYKAGHLIDGGITSLVPVRFARAMGADVVIAVDIYCHGPRAEGLAVPTVLSRVMQTQSCLVAAAEMAEADVLIAPKVSVPNMSTKEAQERVIQAGYEAARAALKTGGRMKGVLRCERRIESGFCSRAAHRFGRFFPGVVSYFVTYKSATLGAPKEKET
jgi:predicted acylesterase/phospholipase RssA